MLQNNENELALMSQCQLENLKRTLYYAITITFGIKFTKLLLSYLNSCYPLQNF